MKGERFNKTRVNTKMSNSIRSYSKENNIVIAIYPYFKLLNLEF